MTVPMPAIEALESHACRRQDRRAFFRAAAGLAVAGGALALGAAAAEAQTVGDADILNFALNLEYLEAQFYSYAATGAGLPGGLLSGTGTAGQATGARAVSFADPVVARMAREIAADEVAHVTFLRGQLMAAAVAQPAIDLSPAGAFAKVAAAAGLPAGFDPYASDDNFLLAAFLFEDLGVTAYKGAAAAIASKVYLDAAAGILAVEAYHAATIRTQLYTRGQANPNLVTYAQGLSDARDSLDGSTKLDKGITAGTTTVTSSAGTTSTLAVSNIVPANAYGVVYGRSTGQVLNIAYLTSAQASAGGFFPAGVNGTITASIAEV